LFVEKFGARPEKVRHILPFALSERVPDVTFPADIEAFFLSHDTVLLSMGWLEPEYDFALQIEALGLVRREYPRAGLIILGEGRLRPELTAQKAATEWAEDVLMPGDAAHEVSLAALARCDIFLRTTYYDGDSISVREALHFGTPVIASDNGMRPEGVTLIPKQDLSALTRAICHQIRQGKPVRRAVTPDRENIRSVYELYLELLDGPLK
jgi:glycosyltransferase involved in cell wall biosynthesis